MKITKQHLRKVIMEEVTNLLKEKKKYGFKRHLAHSEQGYDAREDDMVGAEHPDYRGSQTLGDRAREAEGTRAADEKNRNRRKKAANRPGNRVNEETADEREDKNIDSLWRYARQNRRSLNKLLKDAGHDELEGERDDD